MGDDAAKNTWTFVPQSQYIQHDSLKDSLQDNLLQTVLAVVQDGICILDRELNIIYTNPTMNSWYSHINSEQGQKCYRVFHNRESPCEECPTSRAFERNTPQTDVVRYDVEKAGGSGWQQLYCVPVFDHQNDNPVLVIEYIRDITGQRKAEMASEFITNQNMVLSDFLEQNKRETELLEQTIVANVERCIKPVISYLSNVLGESSMDMVKRQLDISMKGLTNSKSNLISLLTPRELQVAILVKDNFQSKEIADKLFISKKAIDYHRTNIRKKLNLKPEENLQSYLELYL